MRHRRRYRRAIHRIGIVMAVLSLSIQGAVPVRAGSTPFVDIADSPFRVSIEWLYAEGITRGCTPDRFCPLDPLTRGQMAAFLVRMFDLPSTTTDAFTDDETSIYESEINRLAASGITVGCSPTTYCPTALVRRGEMASFLARAIPLNVGDGRNYFRDDNGTTHELDIDRIAAAGITAGCGTWIFCPEDPITRGEMAAFLRRVLFPNQPPLAFPAPGPVTLHVAVGGDDNGNDCLDAGSPCRTIRRAVALALAGDIVALGPGTFNEENLEVGHDLTITGDSGGGTTIDAGGGAWARILTIYPDADVSLNHLTFRGGRQVDGGAIYSRGSLHVADSTFVDNRATDGGGAIYSRGALTVTGSTFTGNHANLGGAIKRDQLTGDDLAALIVSGTELFDNAAGRDGGAIWSFGPFELSNSVVRDNRAALFGGGVVAGQGLQKVSTSTFAGNIARFGGGLMIEGGITIDRSTFNDNTAADAGGGIYTYCGVMELVNSTIADNVAPEASGVWVNCLDLTMRNTTVTANVATLSGGGAIKDTGAVSEPMRLYNSIIAGNAGGDLVFNPNVAPAKTATMIGVPGGLTIGDILDAAGLGNHGGSTQTIALVDDPSNPAVGAGNATVCAAAPVGGIDQRGLPRSGACDLGAYEIQP